MSNSGPENVALRQRGGSTAGVCQFPDDVTYSLLELHDTFLA